MRVLLIVPYFPPDSGPIPSMYGALADDLTAAGRDLLVVTSQPTYGASGRRSWRPYQIEDDGRKRIVRVFVPRLNRSSLWSRLAVVLFFNLLASLYVLAARDIEAALVTNPAFEVFLPVLALRLKGIPFHYRVHDLYPEIAIRLQAIEPRGPAAWLLGRIERMCLSGAKTISAVTAGFQQCLEHQGIAPSKIAVVPDWANTEAIRAGRKDNAFSRTHGVADKFVIGYGGNVGRSQGLENLIEAAARLQDEERIVVMVVGEGASRRALEARARSLELRNVIFLPSQPEAALADVYASWDVGFVSLAPKISPEWLPAKVYTIMASARPVLAAVDADGEVSRLVARSRCGVCSEAGDVAMLSDAIRMLFAVRGDLAEPGRRGRITAEREYSRAVCTKRLIELLDRTVDAAAPVVKEVSA